MDRHFEVGRRPGAGVGAAPGRHPGTGPGDWAAPTQRRRGRACCPGWGSCSLHGLDPGSVPELAEIGGAEGQATGQLVMRDGPFGDSPAHPTHRHPQEGGGRLEVDQAFLRPGPSRSGPSHGAAPAREGRVDAMGETRRQLRRPVGDRPAMSIVGSGRPGVVKGHSATRGLVRLCRPWTTPVGVLVRARLPARRIPHDLPHGLAMAGSCAGTFPNHFPNSFPK